MTTPANRAPRFVVIDRHGTFDGPFDTESEARSSAAADDAKYPADGPSFVHPIGAALPPPAPVKTMGDVAREAVPIAVRLGQLASSQSTWDYVAAAVIAAHEASVRHNVVTRWAVRETTLNRWAQKGRETTVEKSGRTLFSSRDEAKDEQRSFDNWEKRTRIVKVTTRRRRVKP